MKKSKLLWKFTASVNTPEILVKINEISFKILETPIITGWSSGNSGWNSSWALSWKRRSKFWRWDILKSAGTILTKITALGRCKLQGNGTIRLICTLGCNSTLQVAFFCSLSLETVNFWQIYRRDYLDMLRYVPESALIIQIRSYTYYVHC